MIEILCFLMLNIFLISYQNITMILHCSLFLSRLNFSYVLISTILIFLNLSDERNSLEQRIKNALIKYMKQGDAMIFFPKNHS